MSVVSVSADPFSKPASPLTHLFWPRPLVVELGPALITGWAEPNNQWSQDPRRWNVCRAGLELMRLQKRFNGRVVLVSSAPPDEAQWMAQNLGFERCLVTLPDARTTAGLRNMVKDQFGPQEFDILGGKDVAVSLGVLCRRMWHIGEDNDLRRQLLTRGVQLTALEDGDRCSVADLSVACATEGQWSLENTRGSSEAPARKSRGPSY